MYTVFKVSQNQVLFSTKFWWDKTLANQKFGEENFTIA